MVKSLQRKWKRWLYGQMADWLRRELDFYPMSETFPEDVFLVSYPKSGNTWFRYLSMGAIFGVSPEHMPVPLLGELSPDVHRSTFYHRFTSPMFIKSHKLPQPEYRRVVYLVRDGRDALVSYLHHARNFEKARPNQTDAARNGAGLAAGQWHEHVEQWLSNPYGADMLVIRYEDLLCEPVAQLERFCAFAGVARPTEKLQQVVRDARLENLRKLELDQFPDKAGMSRDAFFFRRGEAGSHRSELSPECLQMFEATARPTLQKLGYALAGE